MAFYIYYKPRRDKSNVRIYTLFEPDKSPVINIFEAPNLKPLFVIRYWFSGKSRPALWPASLREGVGLHCRSTQPTSIGQVLIKSCHFYSLPQVGPLSSVSFLKLTPQLSGFVSKGAKRII